MNHVRGCVILMTYPLFYSCIFTCIPYSSFCKFCTQFFNVEGYGEEGKVHCNLVFSKMSETAVCHVVFHLSEDCHGFYAPPSPVFDSFFVSQSFTCPPFVFIQPVINFDDTISRRFKATSAQRTSFASLSLIADTFGNISAFGLTPFSSIKR